MGASLVDVIVFIAALVLNLWALKRRPDWVAGILLITMLVSVIVGRAVHGPDVVGVLALLDAMICMLMLGLWTHYHWRHAQMVGIISFLKVLGAVTMSASLGQFAWLVFAVSQNALAFLQIFVAGGFFDGVVAFLNRIDPRHVSKRGVSRHASREG
jgi:hypothetical protein